ncbi:acyl-ACP--UDP-N-acetylglucosamine O-acyltransferase [Rhizosphaericola mali]|uniref:Acyl-ACP--UDP-N-acetylglucosamine O-acyltransferase n=1 Tax=Rhizosphaericola mali TaxID=2545455 RepID=A0A5P2GEC5_9BACT|nr:acyl-ACP--UDP-N-acetylglucosamine O-acyltransferase [Rhizosphaericola mali]QES89961.1 acyl-ACP--UDP-N-acetylglucosamine O-acyltransferase [Rhizosphaericola mali]
MSNTLSYIHPGAKIAQNVQIDPFSVIHDNVEIGEGTWIGSNVTIFGGARIGKNCKIFPGAVISAVPQDLKYAGEETTAEIGDNTTIRECVTVNKGTSDKWKTVIGKNCLIMAYAHVAHDCIISDHCIISNSTQLGGHITVDEWAIIGGSCAFQQFTHVGAHSYTGGGSLVNKDIPPFVKAVRHPISFGGINVVGLKRRGFTSEQINLVMEIYRYVYNRGLNTSQAIQSIESEFAQTEVRDEVLEFIRSSKLGIIKGAPMSLLGEELTADAE